MICPLVQLLPLLTPRGVAAYLAFAFLHPERFSQNQKVFFATAGFSPHCDILQRVPTGQRNPPEQTLSVTGMQWRWRHFLVAA